MKWLAKPLLGVLTAAIPVFIAACYGAPGDNLDDDYEYDPEKSIAGRVLSSLTGSGIPYIRVTCLLANGTAYDEAYSSADGEFELWVSEYRSCEALMFEDLDGEENGAFDSLEFSFVDDGSDVVVELEPAE